MIRILVVDDHSAIRIGLHSLLRSEPGLLPVGSAENAEEAIVKLDMTRPQVILIDYQLPGDNGFVLCRRIKKLTSEPRVLIYSAYADLALPAVLAGADGVVSKAAAPDDLIEAIKTVAAGREILPGNQRDLLRAATSRLDPEDMPIVAMVLDGTPEEEIAHTLGVSPADVSDRLGDMLERLTGASGSRLQPPDANGSGRAPGASSVL